MSIKKKLKEGIKDQDMFGHHVAWNYNQKGEYHNTFPGGCASILVNIIISIYAIL